MFLPTAGREERVVSERSVFLAWGGQIPLGGNGTDEPSARSSV
jgi:hypothetical protein